MLDAPLRGEVVALNHRTKESGEGVIVRPVMVRDSHWPARQANRVELT
jgi:hypothetical protein